MVNTLSTGIYRITRNKMVRLISALTPWIQWLNMYALVSGVTVGYAMIILIDFLYILFCKANRSNIQIVTKQAKWILWFSIFFTVMLPLGLALASSFSLIMVANRFIKIYAIFIMIIFMNDKQGLDWEMYRKSLEVLVFIACAVIIYQFVSNMLFGYYYDIRIPFLNYVREETNSVLTGLSQESRFRSIFTEPSYFVYFIFQYLPILLFDKHGQRSLTYKEFLMAAFITVCVVLSVSSTGLFLLALVWGVFIVISFRHGRITARNLTIICMAIVGMSVLGAYYLSNETLSFSFERMTSAYDRSDLVWWRLSAGYEDVVKMNIWQILFGYGMGNFPHVNFMNGVFYTILCTGIIGLIMVICWMVSNFRNTNLCGKVATMIWVLLIITEIMALYAPTLIGYAIMVNHYQKEPRGSLIES